MTYIIPYRCRRHYLREGEREGERGRERWREREREREMDQWMTQATRCGKLRCLDAERSSERNIRYRKLCGVPFSAPNQDLRVDFFS